MDCIQAQAIISEALDRSPVEAAVLEAAKAHCRGCDECAAFVRALSDVKRAPLPEPPADLADRIIAAVRAEAGVPDALVDGTAATATAGAGSVEAESTADTLEDALEEPAAPPAPAAVESAETIAMRQAEALTMATATSRLSVGRSPLDRRRSLMWMGAAAAALLFVGVLGGLGIMRLVGGGSATSRQSTALAPTAATAPEATYGGGAPAAGAAGSTDSAASAAATAAAGDYVAYAGVVYLQVGAADVTVSQVPVVGTVRLAFSASKTPSMRSVYAKDVASRIYIADDSNVLQSFDIVTRDFSGVTYSLRSSDIETLGSWPTLPAGIPAPAQANGLPAFTLDSQSTSGSPVYDRVGSTARQGIAIPPNTPAPDRAAGNPNWTWWAPK